MTYKSGGAAPPVDDTNLAVDGSTTPAVFGLDFPITIPVRITRIIFQIIDGSIRLTNFGGLAPLTNGCEFRVMTPEDTYYAQLSYRIKTNADFQFVAGGDTLVATEAGDDVFTARWDVTWPGGTLLLLGEYKMQMVVYDDLTQLTSFKVFLHGSRLTKVE
jgi:hypothetical protein